MTGNNTINHYFNEEEPPHKKYKRTPKKLVKLILRAMEEVGGWIPNDYFHIQMLRAIIVYKYKVYISYSTLYKYLLKSNTVKLEGNYFVLQKRR